MKAFELQNPKTIQEAVALLPKEEGDDSARLLAGGQDLLTELKHHLVEPDRIVNLKQIPGLDGIAWSNGQYSTLTTTCTMSGLPRSGASCFRSVYIW